MMQYLLPNRRCGGTLAFYWIGLTIAVLACCHARADAAEPCLGKTPVTAAKAFYQGHGNFAFDNPAPLRGRITKRFYDALAYEYQCEAGDECAIDSDPWTGAQDGDVFPPVRFAQASRHGDHAAVTLRYTFALDGTQRRTQSATVRLERGASGSCWRVADVISPEGISALHVIEEFRRQYGRR